jgi:hypothetical protein
VLEATAGLASRSVLDGLGPPRLIMGVKPVLLHAARIDRAKDFLSKFVWRKPEAQKGLEARVGIGRFMPCFQIKNTLFPQQKQVTRPLQAQSGFNPLTEGFTETFTEGF